MKNVPRPHSLADAWSAYSWAWRAIHTHRIFFGRKTSGRSHYARTGALRMRAYLADETLARHTRTRSWQRSPVPGTGLCPIWAHWPKTEKKPPQLFPRVAAIRLLTSSVPWCTGFRRLPPPGRLRRNGPCRPLRGLWWRGSDRHQTGPCYRA